jgi:hypothetical protein
MGGTPEAEAAASGDASSGDQPVRHLGGRPSSNITRLLAAIFGFTSLGALLVMGHFLTFFDPSGFMPQQRHAVVVPHVVGEGGETTLSAAVAESLEDPLRAIAQGGLSPRERREVLQQLAAAAKIMKGNEWPPTLRALHDGAMSELSSQLLWRAAAKKAVAFWHISKSGGTSFCAAAIGNNCSVPGKPPHELSNCWAEEIFDGPWWVDESHLRQVCSYYSSGRKRISGWMSGYPDTLDPRKRNTTCKQRLGLLTARKWNFMAIERHVDEQFPCPQLLNVGWEWAKVESIGRRERGERVRSSGAFGLGGGG